MTLTFSFPTVYVAELEDESVGDMTRQSSMVCPVDMLMFSKAMVESLVVLIVENGRLNVSGDFELLSIPLDACSYH